MINKFSLNRPISRLHLLHVSLVCLMLFPGFLSAQKGGLPSLRFQNGKLLYQADSLRNQIPDYSHCGYKASNVDIPHVLPKVVVPSTSDDATNDIQKALDYVSTLPLDENGFRGAILLEEGIYHVSGRFNIQASGIVIRGSGPQTVVKATGLDRATLFRIKGSDDNKELSGSTTIIAPYIPVGSAKIPVKDVSRFHVGSPVVIERPCTQEWIDALDMNHYGGETGWLGWKPKQRIVKWERTITKIEGNNLIIDAPITTTIDQKFGGGAVSQISWPGRISNVGIENLSLESEFDPENSKDENHCWFAITMENIQNAWVRQVQFKHFAGSAVALYGTARKITVEDCISTEPISEIAGQRRNTFFTMGQQTLFLRCYAENGRHDFSTGYMAAGPNAFVQCESMNPLDFSGAIDSWSSGTLYDVIRIDGQSLSFKNRGQDGQGAGWTAANSMFWQCSAARIECFAPPTAQNWAYGAWSQFAGNGLWHEANSHIRPRSLFFAQLAERLEKDLKIYQKEWLPYEGESTSSPTLKQAAKFTAASTKPPIQLKEYIKQAENREPISIDAYDAIKLSSRDNNSLKKETSIRGIKLNNGWLTYDSHILAGKRQNVPWWRGNARPFKAHQARAAITRYVPGRFGHGYTDDLHQVVDRMVSDNVLAINHNYGLWYDRRRDDHERVKRLDGEVWAPFYEQPFSRSGQGEAWDRLSKYDLTKPNPFYWDRLHEFAVLAEKQGRILIHQNYFQHNILEAGAHWTDSPWRPANNINDTGFPEPPPYAGDKRIYLAEQFYDTNHPVRRELHKTFIRQCLDNFKGQSNVIQSISAEYTGPLHFVKFWLDVIDEWEKETRESQLVALGTTKDVQDSILSDPNRAKLIDIIDIRYWYYRSDGTVYAPPGGANLAPRQHARKMKTGKISFESVYKAVSEYRLKYPDKAVIFSARNYPSFGWAVLMGGGSMPVLPPTTNKGLLDAAMKMQPFDTESKNLFGLHDTASGVILYSRKTNKITVDLSDFDGKYEVLFIQPSDGIETDKKCTIAGGNNQKIELPSEKDWVIWIKKK